MINLSLVPDDFDNRAKNLLDLKFFNQTSQPLPCGENVYSCPFDNQYILRMMVRSPTSSGFQIPPELDWLYESIMWLNSNQITNNFHNEYVYVTVRHGIVTSETDDQWHVDGFSMRVPHVPEQNYICSSVNPTEFAIQPFPIPDDFDPFQHNIHNFLQDSVNVEPWQGVENQVYLIDPYCVHRRPSQTQSTMRTFWRISFIPIEIEDDTCTQNPLLPEKKYGRVDIRQNLKRYEIA